MADKKEIKMILRQAKTPSKRRVAEIIKKGTPKEKALLFFLNGDMRYREGQQDMQLLTKKQEEQLLNSYAEGTPEDNELYGYLNRIHAIKMYQKDFVSMCRYYKESLILFTNFYNIFFDYWHECSTMQKTLDCIKQMEDLPFKKESELSHKAILSPLYDFLKGSYIKTKLPYATIKENQFGQLIVDMTGEKGSLYTNLAVAAKECTLAQARANLANAESYLERIKAADPRSISGADVDKAKAAYHGAKAGVASAEASLQLARIDLERTCVRSPITGRAGKALFTKGNYVTPQGSPLAVIVQDDPVRVTFSMPDRDYLDRLKEFEAEGAVFDTKLRLSNGDIIEATGQRDFENNTVDRKTGTIAVRLRYENKNGLLIPGSLVRVITKPVATRLVRYIPQEAVLADAQGDYVYTVNAQNKAVMKRVHLGDEYGSSRFVESGLEKGDKIVVQGIQMLRPGIAVKVVENQKNMDTAAEQAKQSDFDLAPDKDGKKDTKDVKDAKADIKAAKEEPQGKKVPAAMPPVKQQGK